MHTLCSNCLCKYHTFNQELVSEKPSYITNYWLKTVKNTSKDLFLSCFLCWRVNLANSWEIKILWGPKIFIFWGLNFFLKTLMWERWKTGQPIKPCWKRFAADVCAEKWIMSTIVALVWKDGLLSLLDYLLEGK